MSKRYEFNEGGAELVTDPGDLAEIYADGVPSGASACLVLGNPWGSAFVIEGTRESIAAQLREWLELVENSEGGGG